MAKTVMLDKAYLFKSLEASCRYVFQNGKVAHFVGGRFATQVESEVEELQEQVAAGNPVLFIDPLETTQDLSGVDPVAALTERIREQLIREGYQRNIEPSTSEPGKLTPTSSSDVAAVVLNSAPAGTVQSPANTATATK